MVDYDLSISNPHIKNQFLKWPRVEIQLTFWYTIEAKYLEKDAWKRVRKAKIYFT